MPETSFGERMALVKKSVSTDESSAKTTERILQDELLTLEPSRRAQAERIAKSAFTSYRSRYFRALRGELSPRGAIRAFCLHCMGWEREEITRCTAKGCPLWRYRLRLKKRGATPTPVVVSPPEPAAARKV